MSGEGCLSAKHLGWLELWAFLFLPWYEVCLAWKMFGLSVNSRLGVLCNRFNLSVSDRSK